jgi:hypothetical protein
MGCSLTQPKILAFWPSYTKEKVGSVTIFNVNTPFQRLRSIDIPYGKTIFAN